MAIFTLEALQAKHGDSLILHFGESENLSFIVIDGGPSGVYNDYLGKRLFNIRDMFAPGNELPISLLMVSHMDDDHVKGVLELTDELIIDQQDNKPLAFNIENIWFNSFDDIIGNDQVPQLSSLSDSDSPANISNLSNLYNGLDTHIGAIISSTGQGRKLRNNADFLGITKNSPYMSLIHNKPQQDSATVENGLIDWGNGLEIQVIHPTQQRLEEMQEKWDDDLEKAKLKDDDDIIYASYGSRDTSPFNLASIVCLMKFGSKSILLTGDARSDDILDGLYEAELMDNDKIHLDILKMPHHGSDRNMSTDFLRHVIANHYIFSGDGAHHNPDISTLEMLFDANSSRNDKFTIHMTNHEGKYNLKDKLDKFFDTKEGIGSKYSVNYLENPNLSLKVNLLGEVSY